MRANPFYIALTVYQHLKEFNKYCVKDTIFQSPHVTIDVVQNFNFDRELLRSHVPIKYILENVKLREYDVSILLFADKDKQIEKFCEEVKDGKIPKTRIVRNNLRIIEWKPKKIVTTLNKNMSSSVRISYRDLIGIIFDKYAVEYATTIIHGIPKEHNYPKNIYVNARKFDVIFTNAELKNRKYVKVYNSIQNELYYLYKLNLPREVLEIIKVYLLKN